MDDLLQIRLDDVDLDCKPEYFQYRRTDALSQYYYLFDKYINSSKFSLDLGPITYNKRRHINNNDPVPFIIVDCVEDNENVIYQNVVLTSAVKKLIHTHDLHKDNKGIKLLPLFCTINYYKKNKTLKNLDPDAHANSIIYDFKKKSLEIFEPNGLDCTHFNKKIIDILVRRLQNVGLVIKKVIVEDKIQFHHNAYFRSKDNDLEGYCCSWAYFYLELRLANPDRNSTELLQKAWDIMSIGIYKKNLYEFIRKYTIYHNKQKNI